MSVTKITLAAFISASVILSGTAAMAGPKGPQNFQNKLDPQFPGPGPKGPQDFKNPGPKGPKGPKGNGHNFNPAFGVMLGIGAVAAAAAAASDDEGECWKERHNGQTFIVCEE